MNNQELKKLKESCQGYIELKNRLQYLSDLKQQLESKPDFIKYLNAINELNSYIGIDCDKELETALNDINVQDTNRIYVHIESYIDSPSVLRNTKGPFLKTSLNNPHATHKVYIDIEKTYGEGRILVSKPKCEEFEHEHIVLHPDDDNAYSFYYQVRNMFLEDCIKEGQAKAIEKVLKMRE